MVGENLKSENNQCKVETNDKTGQKYTVKGSIYWWPVTGSILSISPAQWNIIHVEQRVFCSFSGKKYSFIHKKNVTWLKVFFFISVTKNKFPVIRNILYFTEKNPSLTDIILLICSTSCNRFSSYVYKQYFSCNQN